ncbi:hypothetical protein CCR94_21360 [Rhodoblastus sphagnicola]|uniref:Cation transporter n=1 Tax=Rhodoblastus sphagnicola TaxID=333368 RepID=A0A2S6MX75_9HYPH|nr:hypothetical protein [Rhodoblastus sphagnicola]MBB4199307.1 hypothetical protein [Rhodoblastus sphagnicola]PPQ26972.1 hypothetical protein CCR94_21360 [Rhodoblastus sphagnicola]
MSAIPSPLLGFARQLSIAHHIPGRIRLKISGPFPDELLGEARRFGKALGAVAGVRSIGLNALARSCTIEYDARAIPPAAWSSFLSGEATAESEHLQRLLLDAARA